MGSKYVGNLYLDLFISRILPLTPEPCLNYLKLTEMLADALGPTDAQNKEVRGP